VGVRPETLRRWEAEGKSDPPIRTPGGRRRYDLVKLRGLAPRKAPSSRVTLAYARVSSPDQQGDLGRQVALLESFCAANGWTCEVLQDPGSGVNDRKKGLRQLIRRICFGEIGRLVITHTDRLLRFGSERRLPGGAPLPRLIR
jgi:putative resolvase